jgi:predicted RNA-binding Zn-ribbon protein involved in translation (DUF1610 family)
MKKGITNILPQDDPSVKLMAAKGEVNDLKAQETAVYAEIGKLAFEQNPDAYPAQANKLRLILANRVEAEISFENQQKSNQAAEQAARDAASLLRCPSCGFQNSEEVKFCQECGAKLGANKIFCPDCGEENPPGTRFCGGCGRKLGE